MTDWTSPALRDRLAQRFVEILREELTPAELEEVRRRNATDPRFAGFGPGSSCASHDFTDTDEAMARAWAEIFPDEEASPDNEAQLALWNGALDEAKRRYLTASS